MTSNNNNEPGHWKIPGSRYPHKEPWLTMRKDTVRLPNGRTIDNYYVWEYPPWINIIAATESREIVLIRQYRHGIGKVSYELSAGVNDKPDQSLLEGAQRELLEETEYGGGVRKISHPQLNETEEISVHPVPSEKLSELIDKGEILQALHAAPIIKYLSSLQP